MIALKRKIHLLSEPLVKLMKCGLSQKSNIFQEKATFHSISHNYPSTIKKNHSFLELLIQGNKLQKLAMNLNSFNYTDRTSKYDFSLHFLFRDAAGEGCHGYYFSSVTYNLIFRFFSK